ncbi:MAG: tetratricopeptide repeat protein [Prevotella sp.]|nr:tetratricopeptide repeat protein [Prevotella sp.]
MKNCHDKRFVLLVGIAISLVITACSTQKNTAKSRWWHSFNTRYNTYYNGAVAYIEGSLEKENGNRDNYTELIPLYTVGNKASTTLGKGNFDRAIEKSQKAIKLHSIKKRPEWNKNRKKNARDIEWLSRREYNPFLWKAWLLMGRSQFHQGAFEDAASTFAYMSRLYQTQPAIYSKARAWLAKSYIEQNWMYDAEDVIRNMMRDSIDRRAQKEWNYTLADYYIKSESYEQAIPYLQKVIKKELRKKQKAREWFLLGQLYMRVGRQREAYKAFQKVLKQSPPYELEFNARIALSEVMAAKNAKSVIGSLKRMAISDNNKEYLDQVYYAIGNVYLSQKDTLRAIDAYEKGNEKSTRNGIEKGVLLLKLGDLYWDLEKFGDAGRCYGTAIGLLDKDRKDYAILAERSKILDELVPFTDAIHLQDSLQVLAKLPEKERNEAIDRVIEALKKKEKEEKKAKQEEEAQRQLAENGGQDEPETGFNRPTNPTNKNATWYFYNPVAVSQGKAAFVKLWGKRENVDNWQRVNKTVVGDWGDRPEMTQAQLDSIDRAEALQDSLESVKDSAQNDPHKREYYLAQIPFTPEQVEESNNIIMNSLHHAGVIFKDKLDNLVLSEKHLRRLTDFYPGYEQMDDVFYHLFLLYSRKGEHAVADGYVRRLTSDYPESQWTVLLTNPHYIENAIHGTHIEDSLYAATYQAFKAGRTGEVQGNTYISATRFPLGVNRDKFIFIGGLNKLNVDDAQGCVEDMKTVVKDYPGSRLSEMAGMIVNGVEKGRRLKGGRFDLDNVWERRAVTLQPEDSTKAKVFVKDRNIDFAFMFVYHPDSVKENQLLFELARFNFTNYMVRNFDVSIEDVEGVSRMVVTGFRSFDEAHLYVTQLYANPGIVRMAKKAKGIIVSEKNRPLLGVDFSYKDYEVFYNKHFAPLKPTNLYLLTEPEEVTMEKEIDQKTDQEAESDSQSDAEQTTGSESPSFVIPEDSSNAPVEEGLIIPTEDPSTTNDTVKVTEKGQIGSIVEEKQQVDDEPSLENGFTTDQEESESTRNNAAEETPAIPAEPNTERTEREGPEPSETRSANENQPVDNTQVPGEKDRPKENEPDKDVPALEEPVAKPEVKEEPADMNENGFSFSFEDEDVPQGQSEDKKKSDKPKNEPDDIEDEYYELDGF